MIQKKSTLSLEWRKRAFIYADWYYLHLTSRFVGMVVFGRFFCRSLMNLLPSVQ